MKLVKRISIFSVCLCIFLSTITFPVAASFGGSGNQGGGGNSPLGGGGLNGPTLYGYIHLDDGIDVQELSGHQISITNQRTSNTDYMNTDQYGFYIIEPTNAQFADMLLLEVTYFDPVTQETIYGSTIIPISDFTRADPTFELIDQICVWFEDTNAPPYFPPPHPDLSISSVYFSAPSQGLEIEIITRNNGFSPVSNILINVYDGINQLDSFIIDRIDVNSFEISIVSWSNPTEGRHEIQVVVDPFNSILEISEINNAVIIDSDLVTELGDIYHFVWENMADRRIHYLNNYISNHLISEHYISYGEYMAINPQIEVDDNRILHVTWIEITPDEYAFKYAWSFNQQGTWFDKYELAIDNPEYEINWDLVEECLRAIIEVGGEIIERILETDPNPDPPNPPPGTRGPLDEPPYIEIKSPNEGDVVPPQFYITGITEEHDYPINIVEVSIDGVQYPVSDMSQPGENAWSSWKCRSPVMNDGEKTIIATAQDTAPIPNVRADVLRVEVSIEEPWHESTYSQNMVNNYIWHDEPGHMGEPNKMAVHPSGGYRDLSPYIPNPPPQPPTPFGIVLYSNHYIQDGDRQLPTGVAYVEIKMDTYYDGDPYQWLLSGDTGKTGENYDRHRVDWGKAYTQDDIDKGFHYQFEQTVGISEEVLRPELNDADEEIGYNVLVFTTLYYRYRPGENNPDPDEKRIKYTEGSLEFMSRWDMGGDGELTIKKSL